MQLLADTNAARLSRLMENYPFICGQLLTPLTRFTNHAGKFAIDNGAFSRFDRLAFLSLLEREWACRERCLFVAAPDVVGNARRTLEAFDYWLPRLLGWPIALVCQDGMEDFPVPWPSLAAVFIGGTTAWKLSQVATDIIKTAQLQGIHTHVGRVNTVARWQHFSKLGVDTCDGSGASRYDWMLAALARVESGDYLPLFHATDADAVGDRHAGAGEIGSDVP